MSRALSDIRQIPFRAFSSNEIVPPSEDQTLFYPFFYQPATSSLEDGWTAFRPEVEFSQLVQPHDDWRLSYVNQEFTVCPTYPAAVVVPRSVDDDVLVAAAAFRAGGRFPVLSYRHDAGVSLPSEKSIDRRIEGIGCGFFFFFLLLLLRHTGRADEEQPAGLGRQRETLPRGREAAQQRPQAGHARLHHRHAPPQRRPDAQGNLPPLPTHCGPPVDPLWTPCGPLRTLCGPSSSSLDPTTGSARPDPVDPLRTPCGPPADPLWTPILLP